MSRFFFISLLSLLTYPALSKKGFEWTPALMSAYNKAINLRFQEAEKELETVRLKEPSNLMVLHVENYLDFFRVYINEDEAEFKKLEKNKDKRIEQIAQEGDPTSPYYLYLQADIRLQWALARLKFEQYSTAFFETNKAFKLLTKNVEKFPDFMPNKKNLGILHAMVGTIPDNYKWAVDWLSSMEGSIQQGREELEEVISYSKKHSFIYEQEIYVYYTYLLLHLDNDLEEAWKVINTANLKPAESPMACFIMANVAMRTDRGDDAIHFLEKRPKDEAFHLFYYLDYMLGLAKLQRLDEDADRYLLRYIELFRGRNFIKDAYQKLAWHYLIHGDLTGYKKYMDLCKSMGYKVVGSDRSADAEARSGEIPVLDLLKARVLFDGGHFQRAYDLLKNKKEEDYLAKKNQLEYTYRMGRISHKLKKYDQALVFYQKTMDAGKSYPYYFACRAALEKGHILELSGKIKEAKEAYKFCLSLSPEDHKTGLHQQAKAGLRRLKS